MPMLEKKKFLQKHLVNLDWCNHYSRRFPTFDESKWKSTLGPDIRRLWDEPLEYMVRIAKPVCIFAHGRSLEQWVKRNVAETDLTEVTPLKNSRNQACQLMRGSYALDTTIPVWYLTHFISCANKNETLRQINECLKPVIEPMLSRADG
jgi:hypothetical protein